MNTLLTLGLFLIGSYSMVSDEECCKLKNVGGHLYNYLEKAKTTEYKCTSDCVYSKQNSPHSRYCFKPGNLAAVCEDEVKPTVPGYKCDRNCTPDTTPLKCVFNLTLEMLKTDATGRRADGRLRSVLAYNGTIPGPPIVICKGDEVVMNFTNGIIGNMTNTDGSGNTSTLHFHGIRMKGRPWSDGVPFVTQCPTLPSHSFPYGFNDSNGAPAGTYWYHSHDGAQRTNGAYGALIIKDVKVKDVIDDAANTLVLQEWYESSTNQIPVSILINGNTRIGELINTGGDEEISNHLQGKGASFPKIKNKYFDPNNFTTNYTEFDVKPGKSYRFRVIGAISQNFPMRLSIDDHKFTAIATDTLDIEPVHNLTDLWLAAGERYDIVVKTKEDHNISGPAFKIRVIGFTDQSDQSGPLCTIAWLKYPKQSINYTFVTDSNCTGFDLPSPLRTLNHVPTKNNPAWINRIKYPHWTDNSTTGDIFIADLREAKHVKTKTYPVLNTPHYIEFVNTTNTFNNKRMTFPRVPFLLQDPANKTDRCGSDCNMTTCTEIPPANCTHGEVCECQHVIKEPFAPDKWTEFVLINNKLSAPPHPIHQHSGWFWVVGEGQYDQDINRTFIRDQDNANLLPRNIHDRPPPKDTIQVPPGGYVIIRTKLDNAGTWFIHCHIDFHTLIGMAMVLQIGELVKNRQDWSTGHLKQNVGCETPPPSPGGGPTDIYWYLEMENATRCVAPGTNVTFHWVAKEHNVRNITKDAYDNCSLTRTNATTGDYIWTAPATQGGPDDTYYFACDRGNGSHCKRGMKAKIHVRSVTDHCH